MTTTAAVGVDLDVGVKGEAEVNLIAQVDPATRSWLSGLPAIIAKEFEATGLRLINETSAQLKEAILLASQETKARIDQMTCNVIGAAQVGKDNLLEGLPLTAQGFADISEMQKSFDALASSFTPTNGPTKYVTAYATFTVRAANTDCKLKAIQASLGSERLKLMTRDVVRRYMLWQALEQRFATERTAGGLTKPIAGARAATCADAAQCYKWLYEYVAGAVAKADPRDATAVLGHDRLRAIGPKPAELVALEEKTWIPYFSTWDHRQLEDRMLDLKSIVDDLTVATFVRYRRAFHNMKKAEALYLTAEKVTATAMTRTVGVGWRVRICHNKAMGELYDAVRLLDGFPEHVGSAAEPGAFARAETAAELVAAYKEPADQLTKSGKLLKARAESRIQDIDRNNDGPDYYDNLYTCELGPR